MVGRSTPCSVKRSVLAKIEMAVTHSGQAQTLPSTVATWKPLS